MSCSASYPALFRSSAHYADRILKGAKPAELPVERAREFDLVINRKTLEALGLSPRVASNPGGPRPLSRAVPRPARSSTHFDAKSGIIGKSLFPVA
jgi:ABC transporter substrate binding protein